MKSNESETTPSTKSPSPRVVVVRDGAAWLASNPAMRSEPPYGDNADALAQWVREWGERALGVEVRDL